MPKLTPVILCGGNVTREGAMLTFGIVANRPETGYGDIQKGPKAWAARCPHPGPDACRQLFLAALRSGDTGGLPGAVRLQRS